MNAPPWFDDFLRARLQGTDDFPLPPGRFECSASSGYFGYRNHEFLFSLQGFHH